MTLSIMTLGIMTLSKMTLGIMTLGILTFNTRQNDTQHNHSEHSNKNATININKHSIMALYEGYILSVFKLNAVKNGVKAL